MTEQNHSGSGDNINIHGDGFFNAIEKHPTLIADIVNQFSKHMKIEEDEDENYLDFTIENKINHNNVVKYKSLISENAIYQGQLLKIYTEFEKQGTFRTGNFLKYIRNKYLTVRGEFEKKNSSKSAIEIVKENADSIIETVRKEMYNELLKSENLKETLEHSQIMLDIIVVDAFMRCKILENPPKT